MKLYMRPQLVKAAILPKLVEYNVLIKLAFLGGFRFTPFCPRFPPCKSSFFVRRIMLLLNSIIPRSSSLICSTLFSGESITFSTLVRLASPNLFATSCKILISSLSKAVDSFNKWRYHSISCISCSRSLVNFTISSFVSEASFIARMAFACSSLKSNFV